MSTNTKNIPKEILLAPFSSKPKNITSQKIHLKHLEYKWGTIKIYYRVKDISLH